MENRILASKLLVKFSILCEVLPYLGHLPLWKYLLLNLSKSTKIVWRKNENAFRECAKGMKIEIVKYQKPLDEEYLKYLKDHDILLNCKICIELDSECGNIALFNDFLEDCLSKHKCPLFHDISIPNSVSIAYFIEKTYNLLKLMNEGQEKVLINKCEFICTRGYLLDNITYKTFNTLLGTKYLDNIQMLLVLKDKRPSYYLSMFKLSKFNVSHINFHIKMDHFMNFYDNLEINEELENEFNCIKSLTFIDYHSGFNKLNIHDSLKKLFPNLSKIIFHSSFSNLTNVIYSICEMSTNIIIDTTSPIFGDCSFIEIGNNNLAISNVNTKYLCAFRKKNEENFKIFSFEYAKVNFNNLNMKMTTKSDYSIIEENNCFCFSNIKMIYDFETNSNFTSSNSEILNLIDFINSHSFDLSTGVSIFYTKNIK